MHVLLEVQSGPSAGQTIVVQAGQVLKVGRFRPATFCIRDDAQLSHVHFAVQCDDGSCRLRDLDSRSGTFLNQARVFEVMLRDGDQVRAGQTTFIARFRADVAAAHARGTPTARPVAEPAAPAGAKRPGSVLGILRRQPDPLFAVLDAARDGKVLEHLRQATEELQSLYEGVRGEVLAEFAPYLVRLPADSPLLETLVGQGWAKSWGVCLTCAKPFREVRKHLRHFLLVRTEDGKELYFRFYDPRVLRVFLPTCTPQETAAFFGPLGSFVLEDEQPQTLLRFTSTGQGAERTAMLVLVPEAVHG
jgi:hypothetical protein